MGWLAAGVGFLVGNAVGGPLGGVIGAVLANYFAKGAEEGAGEGARQAPRAHGAGAPPADETTREMLFLGAVSAMLAKLAKADGRISREEIASAEAAFASLGIGAEKRDYCIRVFRAAKDDAHTIYEYADAFSDARPTEALRLVFYDLLWDLATADGRLSREERTMLRVLPRHLGIAPALYFAQYARRMADKGASGHRSSRAGDRGGAADSLAAAYALLGCAPTNSDEAVRKAYRARAKKLHPDEMMAQGLPPELIQKANDEMARVNAAYDLIRKSRQR